MTVDIASREDQLFHLNPLVIRQGIRNNLDKGNILLRCKSTVSTHNTLTNFIFITYVEETN